MGLLSILPASFAVVETWIARVFVSGEQHVAHVLYTVPPWISGSCGDQLFVGVLIIGPWIVVLVYDLLLYLLRAVSYEIPVIGGRARGMVRPRAPSLTERPSGHRRKFSLARRDGNRHMLSTGSVMGDAQDARYRHLEEEEEDDEQDEQDDSSPSL